MPEMKDTMIMSFQLNEGKRKGKGLKQLVKEYAEHDNQSTLELYDIFNSTGEYEHLEKEPFFKREFDKLFRFLQRRKK